MLESMNTAIRSQSLLGRRTAFALAEMIISMGILAVMFVALYAGISSGFGVVQLARENLRGTQILQEKMETIRLYTWDQIIKPGFIPTNFTEDFFASTSNVSGLVYTGSVSIVSAPVSEVYSGDLKQVTITVNWKSGGVGRKREMSTFVAKNGLQTYIY